MMEQDYENEENGMRENVEGELVESIATQTDRYSEGEASALVEGQTQLVTVPAVPASSAATETDVQTASSQSSGVNMSLDQFVGMLRGLMQQEINRMQTPTVTHTHLTPSTSQISTSSPVVPLGLPTLTPTPTTPSLPVSDTAMITSPPGPHAPAITKLPVTGEIPNFYRRCTGSER